MFQAGDFLWKTQLPGGMSLPKAMVGSRGEPTRSVPLTIAGTNKCRSCEFV
jgi:hypothetical protein